MTPPLQRDKTYENMDENNFPIRKSPRLKGFDYGDYHYNFVTICTKEKCCHFGTLNRLSAVGEIARVCLLNISDHFPDVKLDKWVIMPNHIHAILAVNGSPLPTVVGAYKSAVTKIIHRSGQTMELWQASFYDHVIRNQADYERIWTYIDTNPTKWEQDCFYIP